MVLITGSEGMLGKEFMQYYPDSFGIDINKGVDITNIDQLEAIFIKIKPKVVIHCAAVINVDYCETHPIVAYNVNAEGTGNISKLCDHYGAKLVYISTSMVFIGDRKTPYNEKDLPQCLNNYSLTKYIGEQKILKGLIVRTNIIGKDKGFFDWVYKNDNLKMYKDLNFNTLYIKDFIKAVDKLIKNNEIGIWHVTSRDYTSKYKFARLVQKTFNLKKKITPVKYKSDIPRPKNAVLDCSKYEKKYGKLPTIKQTLESIKEDL